MSLSYLDAIVLTYNFASLQILSRPKWFVDNDPKFAERYNFAGRQRTGAFLQEQSELDDIDENGEADSDSIASYDMLLDEDEEDEDLFNLDDYLDCSNERGGLEMAVEGDGEGCEESEDQIDGRRRSQSGSLLPRATHALIHALQLRLEHWITNAVDYPPAQIIVK